MNTSIRKMKIYVVVAIIGVIFVLSFVSYGISKKMLVTTNYFIREFETVKYKYEYNNSNILATPAGSTLNLSQVSLDYTKSIPVIVYHGIPYNDVPNQYNITVDSFKNQMFALKVAGYNSITSQDLYKYLRGEITLPQKSILITFDDGRVDSFKMADPVFAALNYKATMFVIGRYSLLAERQKYYLSINQLKEMSDSGRWDIEAHSFDGHESYFTAPGIQDGHFFSHKQWSDSQNRLETNQEFSQRIINDFEKVKTGLENILGKSIQSFAFPYGDFGQNNTNFKDATNINTQESQKLFSLDFYQNSPAQRFRNNYLLPEQINNTFFLVKRININTQWTGLDLINELDKTTAKNLPYIDNFFRDNGWLTSWGKLTVEQGKFTLNAESGQTGGTTILDGSRLWKNYSIKASVTSPNLSAVYIWARFQDDDNNAACNFSNGFIHIEQTVDGVESTIQGLIDKKLKMKSNEFQVEVRVKGREIQCILNNIVVKTSFLDRKLSTGGIGLKTWTAKSSTASLIVKNLEVKSI